AMMAFVPKRPRRTTYHHGDLVNALKKATLELLIEVGVDGFTLREAAKRVGVNHRAVYRHFADKTGLLAAVAIDGWTTLVQGIETELRKSAGACAERLAALARGYALFALRHPAHYRLMVGPRLNADQRFPELEAAIDRGLGTLTRELEAGVKRGELLDGDRLQ